MGEACNTSDDRDGIASSPNLFADLPEIVEGIDELFSQLAIMVKKLERAGMREVAAWLKDRRQEDSNGRQNYGTRKSKFYLVSNGYYDSAGYFGDAVSNYLQDVSGDPKKMVLNLGFFHDPARGGEYGSCYTTYYGATIEFGPEFRTKLDRLRTATCLDSKCFGKTIQQWDGEITEAMKNLDPEQMQADFRIGESGSDWRRWGELCVAGNIALDLKIEKTQADQAIQRLEAAGRLFRKSLGCVQQPPALSESSVVTEEEHHEEIPLTLSEELPQDDLSPISTETKKRHWLRQWLTRLFGKSIEDQQADETTPGSPPEEKKAKEVVEENFLPMVLPHQAQTSLRARFSIPIEQNENDLPCLDMFRKLHKIYEDIENWREAKGFLSDPDTKYDEIMVKYPKMDFDRYTKAEAIKRHTETVAQVQAGLIPRITSFLEEAEKILQVGKRFAKKN